MPKKYSYLAIAALIFSLIFFIPTFSIIGIIAGIGALTRISNTKEKGKGVAIAAIAIGILVTALQIAFVIIIYKFFIGMVGAIKNIGTETPLQSIQHCTIQGQGFQRDLCIWVAVSTNVNQSSSFDKNLCDDYVVNGDIKSICNALVRKDKSYCQKITDSTSRIRCFGMLEESNNRK